MIVPPTFKIVISIKFTTQTKCELMQGGVFINTITCILKMYDHFRFVGEGIDYIHSKSHCGIYMKYNKQVYFRYPSHDRQM